jgi:hypothetical protein
LSASADFARGLLSAFAFAAGVALAAWTLLCATAGARSGVAA